MKKRALNKRGKLASLVSLIRPKQWIKNTFVLAPLIFSGQFLSLDSLGKAGFAVCLFCLAASATYIVNDIKDVDYDRSHPTKAKTRPLAAGDISLSTALVALGILSVLLVMGAVAMPHVGWIVLAYVALSLTYTFILKKKPVLDIFCIAVGFVLRVYAGGMAIDVPVSGWMFITTLCLALFLASIKRRQELKQVTTETREVLKYYTIALVDRYAEIAATGALIFYGMFVMSSKPQLVVTIPLVLFGLYRYWYVVESLDGGESPTDALLEDKQLLLTVLLWVAACGWVLLSSGAVL